MGEEGEGENQEVCLNQRQSLDLMIVGSLMMVL